MSVDTYFCLNNQIQFRVVSYCPRKEGIFDIFVNEVDSDHTDMQLLANEQKFVVEMEMH